MTPDQIVINSVKAKTPVSRHRAGAGRMPDQTVEARIAPKSLGSHGQETAGVGHFSKTVRNRVLRSSNQTH